MKPCRMPPASVGSHAVVWGYIIKVRVRVRVRVKVRVRARARVRVRVRVRVSAGFHAVV